MEALAELLNPLEQVWKNYQGALAFVGTVAAVVTLFANPLGRLTVRAVGWFRRAESPQPTLSDPPMGDAGLARYSRRAVALLGRDAELSRLLGFLQCRRDFAWMQIAGAGGHGKSRLGYELMLWARDNGWRAGLVEAADMEAFKGHWPAWQPRRPHLLVLDYVVGREPSIKAAMQALAARAGSLRNPVRILLLERQRWDRGGLGALGSMGLAGASVAHNGRAEWFLALAERVDGNDPRLEATRFEDGVLELGRLDEVDLVTIVRGVGAAEGAEVALSDAVIAERLRQIDSSGRPLYAYFFGQALAAGSSVGSGWKREELLDATLDRDQGSRWRAALGDAAPSLGDGSVAERLAVIATIAGGLDCGAAERSGLIPHADARARRRALILTDAGVGNAGGGPSRFIPALQPDLLGEWFVLRTVRYGLALDQVLGLAWRLSADSTAAFLNRLAQDFPGDTVAGEILNFRPPDAAAAAALAKVAASIDRSLRRAACPLPTTVVDALTDAAHRGDARSMASLGLLCSLGRGVSRDVEQALEWWRKGAEAGDGRAMANLAVCYRLGNGVDRNLAQALAWCRKGVEAGDGRAMANLGFFYERGEGVERDLGQALAWYRKAAEAGDGAAMVSVGVCYQNGRGVERDLGQALAWFRKGAEAGDGSAMTCVGICYLLGEGIERDLAQALAWYRKGAEAGDGSAMTCLGVCYQLGEGIERDLAQALAWYCKGAEAGDGSAMNRLGICCERGEGVERDVGRALAWYRKAAEAGDRRAMGNLADSYRLGKGVERDLGQALAWYCKAAEAGDGEAMTNLGVLYQRGKGVERDLGQALIWYRKGVEAGNGRAMTNLGFCYERGDGVERDLGQALGWYRKGAEAGDGGAMANLGLCYQLGQGVERNLGQALNWYREGAEAGDGGAMANLGVCYQLGQGVESDLGQALHWYRAGAQVGDGLAMANLGVCYQLGEGVERDLSQALSWYREGAKLGNGRAMAKLGHCYEQGVGIERDLSQALAWYREGADAGDNISAEGVGRLLAVYPHLDPAAGTSKSAVVTFAQGPADLH